MFKFCLFAFFSVVGFSFSKAQVLSYNHKEPLPSPILFAEGIISTGDYESHPAFSITGDTLLFVKSGPDVSKWTICFSIFKNKQWSRPEVASFSGQYMDADPFFTRDGKHLYFISNRPIKPGDPAKEDMDIWRMDKTKSGWSAPIHLEAPINSDKSEYYPTLTDHGTLYFGSRRPGGKGGSDIYSSQMVNGVYTTPENLGDAVNTVGCEYEPFISPDEKFIIFMAARPDHLDNSDLFVSYKQQGGWTPAEKLPEPFNSTATEFSPKISMDGKYFFFGSARNRNPSTTKTRESIDQLNKRIHSAGNGLCDIYQVDLSSLRLK